MNNNQQDENTRDASRGARSNRHENANTARDNADRREVEEEKKQPRVEIESYDYPEFLEFKSKVDLKLRKQTDKQKEKNPHLHLISGQDLVEMVDVKEYSKALK